MEENKRTIGDYHHVEDWQIVRAFWTLQDAGCPLIYFGHYLPERGGEMEATITRSGLQVDPKLPGDLYQFELSLVKSYPVQLDADGKHGLFQFFIRPRQPLMEIKGLIQELLYG